MVASCVLAQSTLSASESLPERKRDCSGASHRLCKPRGCPKCARKRTFWLPLRELCVEGEGGMNPTQRRSRHGLTPAMVRVRLRGFKAIDRRTAGARAAMAFRSELVTALGGEADLSPQKRRLIEMTARAALLLDHVDSWLAGQTSLVNRKTKSLLPVLTQRQAIADHLARLLD